ncbi:MAG: hypothetical protein H7836_08025 [Magnetococcus sp. YQC-3]
MRFNEFYNLIEKYKHILNKHDKIYINNRLIIYRTRHVWEISNKDSKYDNFYGPTSYFYMYLNINNILEKFIIGLEELLIEVI